MRNKKKAILYGTIFFILFFGLFYAVVPHAHAQGLWYKIGCRADGDCKLNDFAQIAVNVAKWILGVTGSLALLAFVYGGVLFLISGGSSERVTKGKQAIVGAVIGLIIVFASYMIIGFAFKAMGIDAPDWASTTWFRG